MFVDTLHKGDTDDDDDDDDPQQQTRHYKFVIMKREHVC